MNRSGVPRFGMRSDCAAPAERGRQAGPGGERSAAGERGEARRRRAAAPTARNPEHIRR